VATLMFHQKLSKTDGKKLVSQINQWFKTNPKRKVCNPQLGNDGPIIKVRKGHIQEDVSKYVVD
jgi:hypothetical protein